MKRISAFVFLCLIYISPALAADVDDRFLVLLNQEQAKGLDIQAATALALPLLWKRVVPLEHFKKALGFPAAKSLLLQFKIVKHGMKLVFNPVQVGSFLAKRGVKMIPQQPHWNLSVVGSGFSASDTGLSQDLLNSGLAMADEYGVRLSPRGKRLAVDFSPVMDVYGEVFVHVDVKGDFTSSLLSQTDLPSKGYAAYQLQDFLKQVLLEIRDAYALGNVGLESSSTEIILTIESDYSLASQVMLEQALAKHPAVVSIMPTMLQKMRRQYRIQLRSEDDTWLQAWFEGYGLRAIKQPEGSLEDWLAE
ncbi:MAG: hypothetical protein R8M46_06345 [Ghiorsea sp.]